jgi:hypothetical protein
MLTGDIAQPTDMQPGTRPGANGNIVTLGEIHVAKGICLSQAAIVLIMTRVLHATPLR